jgi:hypothetical protein
MRRFYKPSLWIPQHFLLTNPNLHHGLLGAKALLENSTIGTVRLGALARGRLTAEGVPFPPPEATAVDF